MFWTLFIMVVKFSPPSISLKKISILERFFYPRALTGFASCSKKKAFFSNLAYRSHQNESHRNFTDVSWTGETPGGE